MSRTLKVFIYGVMLLLVLSFGLGCDKKEPIKIGFAGGLTGRHADLGIYGRNGVLLAFEEVNSAGGVDGRPLELVIKDDKQDPETAVNVDKELIEEGVVAIIGHFTSAMSVAAVPFINREKVLMLSPTTATNQLSGKDDYFLRIMSPNLQANRALAEHMFSNRDIDTLVVTYDDQNRAFGKDWSEYMVKHGRELGIRVIVVPFVSDKKMKFSSLTKTILTHEPNGLLIVASALDAAMICQQLRKAGSLLPVFTTMWSMSEDFIHHGGKATEGVSFTNWFDRDHPGKSSREFRQKYKKRFGHEPTFASHFSYEAANVLIYALRQTTNPHELKEVILKKGTFQGTQGTFHFDEYGDVERDFYIMKVEDGKFVRLE